MFIMQSILLYIFGKVDDDLWYNNRMIRIRQVMNNNQTIIEQK